MIKINTFLILILLQTVIVSCNAEKKTEVKMESGHTEVLEAGEHSDSEHHEEGVIEITSQEMARINLKTTPAIKAVLPEYLKTSGEIAENENFTTHITSGVEGKVTEIRYSVGDVVSKGSLLASVESREAADLQSELFELQSKVAVLKQEEINKKKLLESSLAQQQEYITFLEQAYKRQLQLFKEDIAPRKNVEEAEKDLKTASLEKEKIKLAAGNEIQQIRGAINSQAIQLEKIVKRLQLLNFSPEKVKQVLDSGRINANVPVLSPVSGLITSKHISQGEIIEPSREIFTIIDPSEILVYANVYENDLPEVQPGQSAYLSVRGSSSKYGAVVDYIFPQVEEETRTAKVRLKLKKTANNLRKGMFADVYISTGNTEPKLVIPKEAVQRDGTQQLVYVKKSNGEFMAMPVTTGKADQDYIEVISGLDEGQHVVTKGGFTLKALSKKGEMGHHDH